MTDPALPFGIHLSTINVMWMISVAQLLAIIVLLWLHWQTRRDMEDAVNDATHEAETSFAFLRESLASYKMEADRAYASHRRVSAIERRLRDHDGVLEDLAAPVARTGEAGGAA